MFTSRHPLTTLATLLALAAGPVPALATPDFTTVVDVCPAMLGRDPPTGSALAKGCGVWSPDDFAATPSWSVLELMFTHENPQAALQATLQCVNRVNGARTDVARVQSTPGPGVRVVRTRLPGLNFSRCAYMVRLDITPAPDGAETPRPVLVSLRNS